MVCVCSNDLSVTFFCRCMLRKGLAGGFPIAPGWVISLVIPMDEGDRDLAIADEVTRRPSASRWSAPVEYECVVRHLANQGHGASETSRRTKADVVC